MTDELIERINADCETGTPGPWAWDKPNGFTYEGGFYAGNETVCDFGDSESYYPKEGEPPNDTDARRIARVPDMEARILADAKIIKAAQELADAVDKCNNGLPHPQFLINAAKSFRAAMEARG